VPAEHLQRRREPPDLALPVPEHRGRADDEGGEPLPGAAQQVPRLGSAAWGGVAGQPPIQSLLETLGVGRPTEEPLP
jgi:hypothetical protein